MTSSWTSNLWLTCLACGVRFDPKALLINRYVSHRLAPYNARGWGLCPRDQELFSRGYVALVEYDPKRSPAQGMFGQPELEDAYRTGWTAHLNPSQLNGLFPHRDANRPFEFVVPGVIQRLNYELGGVLSPNIKTQVKKPAHAPRKMSLAEFRAAAYSTASISESFPDLGLEDCGAGRIYPGPCFIEATEDPQVWRLDIGHSDGVGTLEELEPILYGWALREYPSELEVPDSQRASTTETRGEASRYTTFLEVEATSSIDAAKVFQAELAKTRFGSDSFCVINADSGTEFHIDLPPLALVSVVSDEDAKHEYEADSIDGGCKYCDRPSHDRVHGK